MIFFVSGSGLGLAFTPTIEAVCVYFDKYRAIAVSIGSLGVCFGSFTLPPVIRLFKNYYGYRGALIMTAAVTLHIVVGGALMRPVMTEKKKEKVNKKTNLEKILNIKVFLNKGYILLCLNNLLSCIGHAIVMVHLSAYATSIGINKTKGAVLYSGIGAGGLFGRLFYGFLTQKRFISAIGVYTTGGILCGITIILVPFLKVYSLLMGFSVIFGLFFGVFGPMVPMMLTDMLGVKRFTSGYGYILVFAAAGTLAGGPLVGMYYIFYTLNK